MRQKFSNPHNTSPKLNANSTLPYQLIREGDILSNFVKTKDVSRGAPIGRLYLRRTSS